MKFNPLRGERFSFGPHFNLQGVVVKRGEPQLICDTQFTARQVLRVDLHWGDHLLILFQTRSRCLIGVNQAVEAEVVVIRVVAVVTAKFIPDVAVIIFCLNAMVAPFPDIVSLNAIVLVKTF